MKFGNAYDLLKKYNNRPIFGIKIGMCSPECEGLTLEEAINQSNG